MAERIGKRPHDPLVWSFAFGPKEDKAAVATERDQTFGADDDFFR